MGIIAKDKGGEGIEQIPPGTYAARCYIVADIGIHQTPWGGKEKVYIGFEVPEVRVEWKDKDGNDKEGPAVIGSRYTLSINEKSYLGQHLTSWRGKPFTDEERDGFDITNVLGAPCLISITHNKSKDGKKVYANINSIMRLPKSMTAPEPELDQVAYSPMDPALQVNLSKLPEWLQKLCQEGHGAAAESAGSTKESPTPEGQMPDNYFDDDIPF